MASVFCAQCGHQNTGDSRFCARCGAPLRTTAGDAPSGDQTTTISIAGLEVDEHDDLAADLLDELPDGFALLVVQRGPNAGSRYLLDKDVTTAGRGPDSDIFLDDVTVSRRHALFTRTGGGFVVEDLGSLNGTYLNRERIDKAPVGNGDEVQIGKFRLVFFTSFAGDSA
ncbi:MAG: zinc-ribbon and FHA domain-containing protein [Frankiaceae bacterium]|nr:zinc-ribbon and FHA domain-containing protein [Frankiaceae bacterium]